MPLAASILADLTGGNRQVRLRSSAQLAQPTFEFGPEDGTVAGEAALSEVLGAGFECAPVSKLNDPDYLARSTEEMLSELLLSVIGAAPAKGDPALHMYQETAEEVRQIAIQWLRREVEKRLS